MKWEPIDNNSAKAILTDKDIIVESVFYFNEQGQIIKFRIKRYKEKSLENLTGYFRDYPDVNNIKIPFKIEPEWDLKSGDFSYAKFKINKIKYNNPSKFK